MKYNLFPKKMLKNQLSTKFSYIHEKFADMIKLTHPEEEAMLAVWRSGEGTVKTFMAHLNQDLPYSTVASIIKNLEKKGYLHSRTIGNANLYSPAITEEDYKKAFMGNVVKDYFDNSYKELVNFFVEQKKLSAAELQDILKLIKKEK